MISFVFILGKVELKSDFKEVIQQSKKWRNKVICQDYRGSEPGVNGCGAACASVLN